MRLTGGYLDLQVVLDDLLDEVRRTCPIREEGEAVHTKAFAMVRLVSVEIGRRMAAAGHPDDPEHAAFSTLGEA